MFIANELYFFPFTYEIRVLFGLLTAHPRIQGIASVFIQQNFVHNPFLYVTIKTRVLDLKRKANTYLAVLQPWVEEHQKKWKESNEAW